MSILPHICSLALAATVSLQPGTARPGDVVRIGVKGSERQPDGTLGDWLLDFQKNGEDWEALVALPVDLEDGEYDLDVSIVTGGEELSLAGSLDVVPPNFPAKQLTVDRKFISPSKAQRAWSARDQVAFDRAFRQPMSPRLFTGQFEWPRYAELNAPFGDLRMFNGKKASQHFGVDIDGEIGDDAFAANDGKVVMARECFGSGNTVLLYHGLGLYTAYFHFTKILVKQGQKVKRGEKLGLIGKTGRVTGPHLHWGAKLQGHWVDAASLVKLDWSE